MKKILLVLFLSIISISLISCKKDFSYDNMNKAVYENLLTHPCCDYIVVCYQANCSNCDLLKPKVEEYSNYANKNKEAMPIFSLNVNLTINKDMLIGRDDVYPNDMIGTNDYTKVKVKATPSIMIIKGNKLVKVISDYDTKTPVTDGKAYLDSLMK